jgi:PAS domain S-box-containing protein
MVKRLPVAMWSMLLLVAWASVASAQARQRVLLLYSYEQDFAPHKTFTQQFRPELSRSSPDPIDFIEVSLQAARDSGSAPDDSMVRHVQAMTAGQPPDLVVPIGGPAAVFAQRNHAQLFPAAPMLLAAVDRRFVQSGATGSNYTSVAVDHQPARLVENILTVLPDTTHIFVVVGASHLERIWLNELQTAVRPFTGRVTFSWANNLSFAEMVSRSASLPEHSAILFAILSLDAQGKPFVEDRALTDIHGVANAPIFAVRSTQLGLGIVGGPLLSIEALSHTTSSVALRLLNGESPQRISVPTQLLATPVFDARELRRWDIDEGRLPQGSVVHFQVPTLWEQHKGPIVAISMASGAQALVVVALVANLKKRRRTERQLREREGRLRVLSDVPSVMLWIAGPDRLCTDFNKPWLEFTGRPLDTQLGHGWSDAIHPEDRMRRMEAFDRAVARQEPFKLEYRVRRHDGEYRWILDTGVPRFLDEGAFAGYVGSFIDITELKLAMVAFSNLSRRLMQNQEQERAWVAKELQEDLCQRVAGLTLGLYGLSQAAGQDQALRSSAVELSRQFAALNRDVLKFSDQLYSTKLGLLGLGAAARSFLDELSDHGEVAIEFTDEGVPVDLPSDVALAVFRVMQEAVRNAVKHSRAAVVKVSLRLADRDIRLDVEDEGVGFDAELLSSRGLGLVALRERIGHVGGECTIDSRPGAGTRIAVRVPLRSQR